ncbi:pyruvate decarboxylase [Didymella exigua CBS 183.55]|uniref:Pyruvate decarboxylase n=1 Tax=Didymella exigua CBS 183.55 TaxID=1150837 RepID=A0A6A5RAK8_9PLEO|nr:pyruvate decarboxylase [Didymella exigua CBS 183.55]KAF1924583.1 pyruvate decarboxylase [Didymella exigua CBS 183.55]
MASNGSTEPAPEGVKTGRITLGRYMWERLHQVGVETIFGVPGDFNLQFLDSIYQTGGLKFITNQNELNAAYAADGYARVKGAPGCFVTTHGVGELSALNGVAGAMSEHVKLIHVVGQTTRTMQKNHMMIHHSIGRKPDHQTYNRCSEPVRYAAAELWDIETAPAEIDRVIRECFIKSGPVYIFLPLDLSAEEVEASLLDTPIDTSPYIDTEAQNAAVHAITSALSAAKHPSILIDALVQRFDAISETQQLINTLCVPVFSANMGKGIIDETSPFYIGVWNGAIGTPGVLEAAESADLMITLGYLPADTNSGGFSRKIEEAKTIHINPHSVVVFGKEYPKTSIKPLLAALVDALPATPQHSVPKAVLPPPRTPLDRDASHITQSWLWPQIEKFLQPGDVIVGETGTSVFGLCDIAFPPSVQFIAQVYYGSIGYAMAATLGIEIARKELEGKASRQGRTVLITGDGSMALTIQELGTMIKAGIAPVIFIINNEGYTVERLIWGAQQPYNDIVPHDYLHLLPLYHHPSPDTSFHRATTKTQLELILGQKCIKTPVHLQLIELVVPKMDTSWRLGAQLAWRGEKDAERLTREGFVDTYGGWGLEGVEKGSVKWS